MRKKEFIPCGWCGSTKHSTEECPLAFREESRETGCPVCRRRDGKHTPYCPYNKNFSKKV